MDTTLKAAALLLTVAGLNSRTEAGEVGAFALVYSWPDGVNNYNNYTKSPAGPLTPAAAGNGWKSYASASFHALAAGGTASIPGTGSWGKGYVGGSAYWFEQITISSPSVAAGTIGVADFTLYFEGALSVSSGRPNRENAAYIRYRWSTHVDGADNVADPETGDVYTESLYAASNYGSGLGGSFRNQPRHHQTHFRFGQPFDFTIATRCEAEVWRDSPSTARAELRCTGWNGFRDISIRYGAAVPDATVTSQSGFNYANAGSTTYAQWASLYQLPAASMLADANNNGFTNQMDYALGLNPVAPTPPNFFLPGTVNFGGQNFASFTYTRPRLGARPGDLTYLPKCSTNLADWTGLGLVSTVAPSTTQTETVTVRSTEPIAGQTREFLKLEVNQP